MKRLLFFFVLVLACGAADGQLVDAIPAPEALGLEASVQQEADGTRLELQISPLVDLYFAVRAQAAERDSAPLPAYEVAVDAARALQRPLGRFGGWGPLDSQVFLAADASELLGGFAELPEPYERRGRTISIRDDAVGLAAAIQELMPGFVDDLWPTRSAELERRIAFLRTEFMPRHQEALAFMMQSLAIPDPGVTVPVFLVTATNPPGAMTYYLRGGAPVSVIEATVGGSNDLLLETILHESSHALDLASRGGGSAFATLRALLEERGLGPRDDAYHTVPHTLMFVQAEETVRRLFNPDHVAYGDATDLYQRTGATAVVEREIWPRHLDGELSLDEALRRIVESVTPQPEG